MKAILITYMCMNFNAADQCTDQQVYANGEWYGPDAAMLCEEELAASRRRLIRDGYERMFNLRCEITREAQ